jgi:hypothetical protein
MAVGNQSVEAGPVGVTPSLNSVLSDIFFLSGRCSLEEGGSGDCALQGGDHSMNLSPAFARFFPLHGFASQASSELGADA